MEIRDLTLGDTGSWLVMRQRLWPSDAWTQLKSEADAFLEDRSRWGLFIADVDGEVVGFAECRLRGRAEGCTTSGVGYLEGWYVESEHRRRGIGRALVERCEAWARERGAPEMTSDTSAEYPDGEQAHPALGFVEVDRPVHFRNQL